MTEVFTLAAALHFSPPGDGPRRFRMEAYDGGLLRLANLPHPAIVDLQGMSRSDQVKALLHHDPARPVGHMDEVEIDRSVRVSGVLSVPEQAAMIEAAQQQGFAWEASIGASIMPGSLELVPRGRTVAVNGRQFAGPVFVARRTVLREVSFTGLGAGEHTQARIVAASPLPLDSTMPDTTPPTDDQAGSDLQRELEDVRQIKAALQADADANRQAREELAREVDTLRRQRLTEAVDRIAAQYGCEDVSLVATLRDKARAGEVAESEIELQILRASGNQKLRGFAPLGAASDGPAVPQVIEAALCLTSGWQERELSSHFDARTIDAALGNRWIGFGLHALGVEYLRAHGHHVLGGKLTDEDVRQAMVLAEQEGLRASAGFSSLSLPGILSNVARKEVLRGYDVFAKAILTIARQTTATDYKPFFMYRLNTSGLLEQVGPDGELKSMELAEDEYQSRVYPFGRKLQMTNVMFRNDDVGAFRDLARLFGLTGARTLERVGFKTLLSQRDTFWTTDKGNRLASGAGSALSLESLRTAYSLFLKAKDSTGEPIGLRPRYLLTGSSDHTLALDLNKADRIMLAIRDSGAADEIIERPSRNTFQGMFEALTSPYLDNGVVTNANGTQWLLAADPQITAPIVVAFLDGRAAPQIKPWESLPGRLGMQWDITLNFGFNLHDDRAAVFSPGQ